jgi:hypothetical protein
VVLFMLAVACSDSAGGGPCDPIDPVLADSSFVLVVEPLAGARSASPLQVRGCSRTFESNVVWQLRGRDGSLLASGFTPGGGVDGADSFSFMASFETPTTQVGALEVLEPDASDGEGHPPGRAVIPVVLLTRVD